VVQQRRRIALYSQDCVIGAGRGARIARRATRSAPTPSIEMRRSPAPPRAFHFYVTPDML
jgi:hypothetical protein